MSLLKDFYDNPDLDEQEDSEQDSDFIPDEYESDDQEIEESDDEEEEAPEKKKVNKKDSSAKKEDVEAKKSRIDAIWADMNKPQNTSAIKQESSSPEPKPTIETEIPTTSTTTKRKSSAATNTNSKRPKSNLNSLISKYNIKEPKLNTLEKSKLDWQGFVKKEGIEDELKYKNKDGYMEKVAFLNRVDDRRLEQLKQGKQKDKQ